MDRDGKLIAAALFVISLTVYLITIAPTLSFWDCGEFIACSYIMGIPHPPGAPLFIMIGRFFTLFPFFGVAVKVNFISALSSAVVVALLFMIIVRIVKEWKGEFKSTTDKIIVYGSGFIGALSYAFSDTFWFNAVEAEVYAVSMLFTALVLWLGIVWMDNFREYKSVRFLLLIVYLFGLGAGVHLLNLLVIPTIFLLILFTDSRLLLKLDFWRIIKILAIITILVIVGYSTYFMILIRSGLEPAINQNNPVNLENFMKYLRRDQYGTESQFATLFNRAAPLWSYQIKKMFIRYFGWQFIGRGTTIGTDGRIVENISFNGLYGIPFILGIIGVVYHFCKDWKRAFSILVFFIMTSIALVIYQNQADSQPRERDYFYVGCFYAFAIWIGISTVFILETIASILKKRRKAVLYSVGVTIFIILILSPVNMFRFNFHSHDRSGNYAAWDFAYNMLQSCEPNAILFTNGDNDTFPLWYMQEVENIRKDIRVANLALLNTNWYVMQLKYQEPKVPIQLSDEEIKKLGGAFALDRKKTLIMKIDPPLNRYYMREMEGVVNFDKEVDMIFDIEPTIFDGKALRSQDYMIFDIIQSFKFLKPLYFAVTVEPRNMLGLRDYMRTDGLAYKVLTVKGHPILPAIIKKNIYEKFKYRNLDNPKVYLNEMSKRLLQNLRKPFLDLLIYEYQNKNYPEALKVLDNMNEKIPMETLPITVNDVLEQIGRIYYQLGRPEELEKALDELIKRNISDEKKIEYAKLYYLRLKKNNKAIKLFKELFDKNPENFDYLTSLIKLLKEGKEYKSAVNYLDNWISVHPDDENAVKIREDYIKNLNTSQDSFKKE